MATPIGIDLGTTFSLISYLNSDGRPLIIPQVDRSVSLPSVIAWDGGESFVGSEAKDFQRDGHQDVAAFFKRRMGDPTYSLEYYGEKYDATRLSSLVLAELKRVAISHLGEAVTQAVITVPAYFDNKQREATMAAARLAGIEPLSIINEPTAAALAYGIRANREGGYAFVYDLGGGTFDVSIVKITDTELMVIATDGNHELGGQNWDEVLINEVTHRFEREFGVAFHDDASADITVEAENLKRALSARSKASIRVASGDQTATYEVTRDEFEEVSKSLVESTRTLSESVLREAGLAWQQIDYVVPVGGSTRLPMVQELLVEMTGKQPEKGVQPDEAVALGAAIKAALDLERLNPGQPVAAIAGRKRVVDVMSHSLGLIAISDEEEPRYINSHVIKKNVPVPAEFTKRYKLKLSKSTENRQDIFVTQGELEDPQSVAYLDLYAATGIPNTGASEAEIDVTFGYDANGIVQVSAVDRASGSPLTITREPLPEDVPARFLESPRNAQGVGDVSIYIVVDVSGSMSGGPIEEAKKAALAFTRQFPLGPVKVGVMAVSDSARSLLEPSSKEKEIKKAVKQLEVGITGGANRAHPFDELYRYLSNEVGAKFAIVLADGVWSNQPLAIQRAQRCHEAGIEVVGIGFGQADKQFLDAISSSDAGIFTDLSNLTETFSTIAQEIRTTTGVTG